MQDDTQSPYNISILIEELKHEEVQVRLNAMRRLQDIAKALGQKRTREELLPFLQISIDDEDEVLFVLAEQLGFFLPLVGGPQYSDKLLDTLETISGIQEALVRDEAVKSLVKISKEFSNQEIENLFLPLVLRLCHGEWFTSKISACGILPHIYSQCDAEKRAILRTNYKEFFNDEVPMIKRAAADNLNAFVEVLEPEYSSNEFFDYFVTLSHDEQDSIRILIVQTAIIYMKIFSEEDINKRLLPVLLDLTQDDSWRVRWSIASRLNNLFELIPASSLPSLVEMFITLLSDTENEVKAAISANITSICAFIDKTVIIRDVLPNIHVLILDPCEHVRSAVAQDLLGLSSILGKEDTLQYILPLFNDLLQDTSSDVRLLMISNLNKMSDVIGIDTISDTIIPCIYTLSTDKKWRVRLAILNYLPTLANHLQQSYFDEHLFSVLTDLLYDNVCEIRETCCKHLELLKNFYGDAYIDSTVLPELNKMLHYDKYLYRITALHALTVFVKCMPESFIINNILPIVLTVSDDPVPNVRFNVAKTLGEIAKHTTADTYNEKIYPILEKYISDTDYDVQSFANEACIKT